MGSKWESGAVPVRKRGGLGAPCDWMRGDAGCHCVRLLCITRRVGSTPRPLGSVAAVATAASPPGSVAAAARRPLAFGVGTVAARGSGALGSWHSFGPGSFGLDTAVALTPLVRPLGSPALTPLVRSFGSSPSASCPAPLFRRFRLAVRGIAPCDARCWLPDNWASMSLLAVLLKFARYA